MKNKGKYRISFSGNHVLIELGGAVTVESVLEASTEVKKSIELKPGMPEIWDITFADLSDADPDVVAGISSELEVLWAGAKMGKVAVVSEKPINFGHIHLFRELYNRDYIKSFDMMSEAEKWIADDSDPVKT